MRPRGVTTLVSGRATVAADELRKKLGDGAWYVLQQFWKVRDAKTGETHVTNAGLASGVAGFAKQALRVVRKACARLIEAGLLVFVGRRLRHVLRGRAQVALPVHVRVVYGAFAEQGLGSATLVYVPKKTSEWVTTAFSWGGVRTRSKRGRLTEQEGPMAPSSEASKRGRRSVQMDPLDQGPSDSSPSEKNTAAASAAVFDSSFGWGTVGTNAEDSPESSVGLRLEATRTRPKAPVMPTSPLDGCPPLPWSLVPFATTPNPPNLVPEMKPDERALRLADAFRGALASRFPNARDFSFRSGVLSRSKHFPMLLEAAEFMIVRELAPAAWAAWSMDVWKTYTEKGKPPPVAWVFGPKRLAERRGWFEAEETSYLGGTALPTPKRDALLRRYMSLRYAIHNAAAWDAPAPLVAKFFPGDLFDRLVVEAKAEVERVRVRAQRDVDAGSFIW